MIPAEPHTGVVAWLRRLVGADKPAADTGLEARPYSIFTNEFDRVVSGTDIQSASDHFPRYSDNLREFPTRAELYATRVAALESESPSTNFKIDRGVDLAVSVLVDHSGSLRKHEQDMLAACATHRIASVLLNNGVTTEVLGFTTRDWRGGRSKEAWSRAGRPAYPGRLNDLLHIVYREAGAQGREPPVELRELLRHRWLKENIDGEAVLWALDRLKSTSPKHRAILVVSDGAPVDDETLTRNDAEFLFRHLKEAVAQVRLAGVRIGGIGIGYDVRGFYPSGLSVVRSGDLERRLPIFLERFLDFSVRDEPESDLWSNTP